MYRFETQFCISYSSLESERNEEDNLKKLTVRANLDFRNEHRNKIRNRNYSNQLTDDQNDQLTNNQNKNFATISVSYTKDGKSQELKQFSKFSAGNNANTKNHAERLAWFQAKKEMDAMMQKEQIKILEIAIVSELT